MSATFPPGASDNGADIGSRTSTVGRTDFDESRSTATESRRASSRQSNGAALRNDLENLKEELDILMTRASTMSETELRDAYAKMMTKFSSMRFAAKGMAAQAGRQLNQGVDITSDYVKERPLQSVAMAAGIGLVLGVLLGRG